MKANMGTADRMIRAVAGVILILVYATGAVTGVWGIVLLILATIFLATAVVAYCPVYAPLGISTCRTKPSSEFK